jgi:hypothetical protein
MTRYAEAFEKANNEATLMAKLNKKLWPDLDHRTTLNPYKPKETTEILNRRGEVYSRADKTDSGIGKFYKRLKNVSNEVRFLDENPFEPVTTGNKIADTVADWGGTNRPQWSGQRNYKRRGRNLQGRKLWTDARINSSG